MAVACVLGPQELSTVNTRAVKVIYTHVQSREVQTHAQAYSQYTYTVRMLANKL